MISPRVLVCCSALITIAAATGVVDQCPGMSIDGLSDSVQLTPCKRSPCKLKKGTDQHIQIAFTPSKDVADVKDNVKAEVLGLPVPFIGVDGSSICDKLTTEEGEKASCPLKGGTKYIYKDSFPVHTFYPEIQTRVHWSLQADGKDIICFEVPVKIKQ